MAETSVNQDLRSHQSTAEPSFPMPSSTAVYRPRIRRNFPRSKLGCLTCRSRRKKCDERPGTCRNCEKRKIECSWPPLKEAEQAVYENQPRWVSHITFPFRIYGPNWGQERIESSWARGSHRMFLESQSPHPHNRGSHSITCSGLIGTFTILPFHSKRIY